MTSPPAVIRWIATWLALGVGAGIVLMAGDSGHLPRWLLPPLAGGAGAAGGGLSWLMLAVARRLIPGTPGQPITHVWSAHLMATAAGVASMALLAPPIGIILPIAVVFGAVAGLVSSLVTGSSVHVGTADEMAGQLSKRNPLAENTERKETAE